MIRLLPFIPLAAWLLVGLATVRDYGEALVWLAISPVAVAAMMFGVAWARAWR